MKKAVIIFSFFSFYNTFSQCFTTIRNGNISVVAKKTDNTFWGWGAGFLQGNTTGWDEWLPVQFPNSGNWQNVFPAQNNTFAITTSGTLLGTGANDFGQMGLGTTTPNLYNEFVQIGTANNWKSISQGESWIAALKTNGTLWTWGINTFSQLGDGTNVAYRATPLQISPDTDWAKVFAGKTKAGFAIKNNGTLWGWGYNGSTLWVPQGTQIYFLAPTQLGTANDWATIAQGRTHILALKTNGTLWAWGENQFGESGYPANSSTIDNLHPYQIGTDSWVSISANSNTSMGVKTNGTLWAWGRNDVGQLGDGTTTDHNTPTQIGTDTNWAVVSCGYRNAVALKTDGSYWAWGYNAVGQLGNGTNVDILTPTQIAVDGCVLANEGFETLGSKVVISPNPVKNILNISFNENVAVSAMSIYNTLGQLVQTITHPSATNDVSGLKVSTYFVKMDTDKGVINSKFVKE